MNLFCAIHNLASLGALKAKNNNKQGRKGGASFFSRNAGEAKANDEKSDKDDTA